MPDKPDELRDRVEHALKGRNLIIRFSEPGSRSPEDLAKDIEIGVSIHDEVHRRSGPTSESETRARPQEARKQHGRKG